jgi:HEAT repeat protein
LPPSRLAALRESRPAEYAADAAADGDPAAIAELARRIGGTPEGIVAAEAMARLPDPRGTLALMPLLAVDDAATRAVVCSAVTNDTVGDFDPRYHDRLLELLADSDAGVRLAAARGIGMIARPADQPRLIEALGDRDAKVRAEAIRALEPSLPDPQVAAAICARLDDPDRWVRVEALQSCAWEVIPGGTARLMVALRDPDAHVRAAAVNAATYGSTMRDPAVASAIQALRDDADGGVRSSVDAALERTRQAKNAGARADF